MEEKLIKTQYRNEEANASLPLTCFANATLKKQVIDRWKNLPQLNVENRKI